MWSLAGKTFDSHLLVGTALYPSPEIMKSAIHASGTQIITAAIRRQSANNSQAGDDFWSHLKSLPCDILPNTAGCHTPQDAITTAHMCREIFNTNWIKLEVTGDEYNLQPDPFGLVEAASVLIKDGFEVFPYCTDDLVLCKRLLDVGCTILMPWGAPIGSGQGLLNPYALQTLRDRLPDTPLIIDAGIGLPSHAAQAMEWGFNGILLNSAIALAADPVRMAGAFKDAVSAGYQAHQAGAMPQRDMAHASTPQTDVPFWHQ